MTTTWTPTTDGLDQWFRNWTDGISLGVTLIILFAAVLGLVLSFSSFIRIFNAVRDEYSRDQILMHALAIICAGFISLMGVIWGFSSLLFTGGK